MSHTLPWSYELLDPRNPSRSTLHRLNSAYDCWHESWSAMLEQLDGNALTHADDFSRQHQIGALFHGDDCAGVSAFRWVDPSVPFNLEDSYFSPWPRPMLRRVLGGMTRVCIGSNLVVAPEFRGTIDGSRVSEMLLSLAVRRFHESDAQLMVGTMRNDRRMNDLSYRLGARPILQGANHHNVEVDLVIFERSAAVSLDLPPIHFASSIVTQGASS
ncbi:MAG: hypothetical protein ABI321_24525 [Polyangia bacterium]